MAEDGNTPVAFALLDAGRVVVLELQVAFGLVKLLMGMRVAFGNVMNQRVRSVCL